MLVSLKYCEVWYSWELANEKSINVTQLIIGDYKEQCVWKKPISDTADNPYIL